MDNLKQVVATINGEIDGIKTAAGDLAVKIIECAGHCLAHAKEHGDTSLIQRLLTEGLADQPQWRGSIIRWAREYSPFNLDKTTVNLTGPGVWNIETALKTDPRTVGVDPQGVHAEFDVGEGLGKSLGMTDRDFAASLDRAIANAAKAMENTVYDTHGRATGAIDPAKKFYVGSTSKHTADMLRRARDIMRELASPLSIAA